MSGRRLDAERPELLEVPFGDDDEPSPAEEIRLYALALEADLEEAQRQRDLAVQHGENLALEVAGLVQRERVLVQALRDIRWGVQNERITRKDIFKAVEFALASGSTEPPPQSIEASDGTIFVRVAASDVAAEPKEETR